MVHGLEQLQMKIRRGGFNEMRIFGGLRLEKKLSMNEVNLRSNPPMFWGHMAKFLS